MKLDYRMFDIVLVDFGKVEFAGEQGGIRPAIIVQNTMGNIFSSTTIVLPMTTKIKRLSQPTHSLLKKDDSKGIDQDSMILGECIRQISENRIIKKLGEISTLEDKKEIKRVYDANFGEVA